MTARNVTHGMKVQERHRKNAAGDMVHYVEMWCPVERTLPPPVDLPTQVVFEEPPPEMTIRTRLRFEARTLSELILPWRK